MLSANAFKMGEVKILSCGKGLTLSKAKNLGLD